jgi:hypothetical protein
LPRFAQVLELGGDVFDHRLALFDQVLGDLPLAAAFEADDK